MAQFTKKQQVEVRWGQSTVCFRTSVGQSNFYLVLPLESLGFQISSVTNLAFACDRSDASFMSARVNLGILTWRPRNDVQVTLSSL